MTLLQKSPAFIVLLVMLHGLPSLAGSGESTIRSAIKIGRVFSHDEAPQSRVITKYFEKTNDEGGINGRRIEIITYDDGGNSKKTLDLVRRLVEQDHVEYLFHLSARALGAVRPYVRFKKIPVLFHQPPLFRQAEVLGNYLSRHFPNATIAVIRPAGSTGLDYMNGFYEGMGMEHARKAITHADEIASLDQSVNQVRPVSVGRAGLLAIFGPVDLQLKLRSDLAKLEWNPLLVTSDAVLSLEPQLPHTSGEVITIATGDFAAAINSTEWKAFSRAYLTPDDGDINAAAYDYFLARSIVSTLRSGSEALRCELNVVRFNGRNWETAESGIPCERSQYPK
jgi:hypothetical protein